MIIRLFIFFIFTTLLFGCNSTNNEKKTDDLLTQNFKWKSKKDLFKYSNLKSIDFNSLGRPVQHTDNLTKVDNDFKTKYFF